LAWQSDWQSVLRSKPGINKKEKLDPFQKRKRKEKRRQKIGITAGIVILSLLALIFLILALT